MRRALRVSRVSEARPGAADSVATLVGLFGDGVGEEVFQRRVLLLAEFGVGQRLAREHLVAHGCVVDEDRFDRRGLFQVPGLEVFVDVLIGVVGFGFVVERVLDELEAGDADRVEREMVGAAGIAQGDGGDAEVVEGLDPLGEDGRDEGVLLEIDAANLARSVIEVEVGGDLALLGLEF